MNNIQISEPDVPITANVIKYDNQFNEQKNFNKLTGKEQDLFFAIILCLVYQNRSNNGQILQILIEPERVKKMAGLNNRTKHYTNTTIKAMLNKLSTIANGITFTLTSYEKDEYNQIINDEKGNPIPFTNVESIFDKFAYSETNHDAPYVLVRLKKDAAHYFFNITEGFTQFFYENYIKISSRYGKAIYRELLNGSNALKGEWDIDVEELADWLNITKRNTFKRFRKNLKKYIAEILRTDDFKEINVEYIYATKRGKKSLTRIKFKYRLNPKRMHKIENTIYSPEYNQDKLVPINLRIVQNKQVTKEPYLCPACKGQVYSFTTKFGEKLTLCKNSEKYNLGTHKCRYQNFKEDLKNKNLWIEDTDKEEDLNTNPKSSKTKEAKPFIPPTVEEAQQYIDSYKLQKNYTINIDAENFIDHYEATSWKKKNGMQITNWQPLARTWVRNAEQYQKQKPNANPQSSNQLPAMTTEQKNDKARKEAEELGIKYSN